jgi:hypothetical protein
MCQVGSAGSSSLNDFISGYTVCQFLLEQMESSSEVWTVFEHRLINLQNEPIHPEETKRRAMALDLEDLEKELKNMKFKLREADDKAEEDAELISQLQDNIADA